MRDLPEVMTAELARLAAAATEALNDPTKMQGVDRRGAYIQAVGQRPVYVRDVVVALPALLARLALLEQALRKVWELWPTEVYTEELLNEVERALDAGETT